MIGTTIYMTAVTNVCNQTTTAIYGEIPIIEAYNPKGNGTQLPVPGSIARPRSGPVLSLILLSVGNCSFWQEKRSVDKPNSIAKTLVFIILEV